MAIREGHRLQMELLPPSIEQYVAEDAPVRVYDAFVEALDPAALGLNIEPLKEGNPCYDPKAMLKLLLYGYSYGVRSSRKLERETHYNLSFMWLMGGLKPDHKTIAEFRRNNKDALKRALTQCVRLCLKLDLIDGNILFVDGSKIRGNAAIKNTWDELKCRKVLAKAEQRISEALAEAEALDRAEDGLPAMVKITEDLTDARSLKERVTAIMAELERSGKKTLNTVDKECARINSLHGTGAGYNAQVVVDDKHGLIVSSDAISANFDQGQFSIQIDGAAEVLGKPCQTAVADAGFANIEDLGKIDSQGIQVIVPTARLISGHKAGEFDKRSFKYDPLMNCYYCPRGEVLVDNGLSRKRKSRVYRINKTALCLKCPAFGQCTTAKWGRKVTRLDHEMLRQKLEEEYALSENQAIYKRRQQTVELVFGHFKRNLGVSSFLLRGQEGAKAEVAILSVCFDVRRMLSLLGHRKLLERLKALPESRPYFPGNILPDYSSWNTCAN